MAELTEGRGANPIIAAGVVPSGSPEEGVTCTINGVQVTVPKGTRILEAAAQAGAGVPYYCYHPGLSAPAMCRMCLVEVEGSPKLVPSCVTAVAEGQVIHTEADRPREAREGNLEFYLLNHPLDCPICDKAGECKLQDYTFAEGRKHGRTIEPKRVLNQDDFGGDVLYEGDRCIMCTRCVRFEREIAGNDALCVVERGDRSVIDTFFDHGLDGDIWSGNVIDICPVGALLSKDFLHKARVWELDRASSICPNCSQGCNVYVDTRDNVAVRLRPRPNPEVNSYWMCDYGRLHYEWFNRTNVPTGTIAMADTVGGGPNPTGRIEEPMVRDDGGRLRAATWQEAIVALVEKLGALRGENGALAVASPFHANEDAGLLRRLVDVLGGGDAVFRVEEADDEVVCPGFPKLARRRELAANGAGLRALGYERVGDAAGEGGIHGTAGKVLIVLGDALTDQPEGFGADAALFVYLGANPGPAVRNAHFILPVTSFAEQEGTFTNFEGRVQRFWPALEPPPLARPAWQVLGVTLAGLEDGTAPANAAAAFARVASLFDAFGGLGYEHLGGHGALLPSPARIGAGEEA